MKKVSVRSHSEKLLKPAGRFKSEMSGTPGPLLTGAKKNARDPLQDAGWTLEPHVCRSCFARLLSRKTDAGETVIQCSNCGALSPGPIETLCACGAIMLRDGVRGPRPVTVGLRCRPNPSPTPDFPSLFVASIDP